MDLLDDERLERSAMVACVGDKLALLERALRWLRETGIGCDAKHRLIACDGPRELDFGARYLGADDRAGPNFTGQPAADSYYVIGSVTPPATSST